MPSGRPAVEAGESRGALENQWVAPVCRGATSWRADAGVRVFVRVIL